ncbi:peroxisome assembly protein (Peroxin-2) [Dipsacomyces acuminosporus]|nr:peroxisome assembly protein (Peroxin-2) [Dipsacomyces acuminosporus]
MDSNPSSLPQESPRQQWKRTWSATNSHLQANIGKNAVRTAVPRNSRVNKLDADLLDDELTDMLREPVSNAMSLIRPGFVDKYRLEIDTAIKAVLFWLSVGSHRRATYGQSLQNLTYDSSVRGFSRRVHLFGILSIGGSYAWTKLASALSLRGWADAPQGSARSKVWRLVDRIEKAVKVATLVNFLAFISTGQYKTAVERVLGLRLIYARPQMSHSVSFEFLNRQLVWHAFTEFVMFAMPLVNPAKARAWVVRNIRSALRLPLASVDLAIASLPDHICAICLTAAAAAGDASDSSGHSSSAGASVDGSSAANHITNPYMTGCGHKYCYVCIQTKMLAEADECLCLRCGSRVDRIYQFVEN